MYKLYKSNWKFVAIFLICSLISVFPKHKLAKTNAEQYVGTNQIPTKTIIETEVQALAPQIPDAPKTQAPNPVVKPAVAVIKGSSLRIDAIGLNIPLGSTGLDKSGHLIVPANPNTAAWYKNGPKIGEKGTALITGHLDSAAGPGVFYNLEKLKVGDRIQTFKADGEVVAYKVDKLASYPQDNTFPWKLVYNTDTASSLRIITCDGVYNSQTGHYSRNLVVYASLL